jgi:IS5 family transposase
MKTIEWSAFDVFVCSNQRQYEGAPGYPPLTMSKIVLLQQWYTLSDPQAEEAVRDRLSFRRFCGIPLDAETPDHSSICRFRQTVDKLGLSEKLLAEINRQLDARGLIVKRGTLVDATADRIGSPEVFGIDEASSVEEAANALGTVLADRILSGKPAIVRNGSLTNVTAVLRANVGSTNLA